MTNPFDSADDFFSGGNPSISFKGDHNLGRPKGGTIVRIGQKQQQTDFKTKQPETWDDGTPKMVLPIELITDERDPQDPHDDGGRTLWVGEGSAMKAAIGKALRATRSKLRPGGVLMVAWVSGKGEAGDPKQYQAQYTPGAGDADAMFNQPAAAPAAGHLGTYDALGQYPAQQAPVNPFGQQQAAQSAQTAPAGLWGNQAPPPAQPPANPFSQQQAAPATNPFAQQAPPAQPPAPAPAAAPGIDLHAIAAAYGHLTPEQQQAIAAGMAQGMTVDQVVGVFGPPRNAA